MTDASKPKVTFEIPPTADRGTCRSCGAPFAWVPMKSGKLNPIETDGEHVGESHFAYCPGAAGYRRPR